MTSPVPTKQSIAPYLTSPINEYITKKFTDDEIPQLFTDSGVERYNKGNKVNYSVHMHWRTDESDKIIGIFVSGIYHNTFFAWTRPTVDNNKRGISSNSIWISGEKTIISGKGDYVWQSIPELDPSKIKVLLLGKKAQGPVPPLNITNLDNIKGIAEFFDQNRNVLPPSLHERVFKTPPQTLAGIAPYLTGVVNKLLTKNFTKEEIPKLFSEEGVTRKWEKSNMVYSISMKWKKDESDQITGIFIRGIYKDGFIAWTFAANKDQSSNDFIWITNEKTTISGKDAIFLFDPKKYDCPIEIEVLLSGDETDEIAPPLDIKQPLDVKCIAEFFDKDREILPKSLQDRVFNAPPESIDRRRRILGGLAGALIISLIAYHAIKRYQTQKPKVGDPTAPILNNNFQTNRGS